MKPGQEKYLSYSFTSLINFLCDILALLLTGLEAVLTGSWGVFNASIASLKGMVALLLIFSMLWAILEYLL